ncbi:2a637dca-ac36-486d-b540-8dc2f72be30c [Sclerotinia trifoliorum]|uniref:protein-tyrosine-phosphatase n=1 Tax=Sclerotinia trifoliorum TaxID=28548 RepID=A0A8H2VWB2_9HELO|nr:2a637dca-ac36-486d-b540-8dc2f72be30c [Sclerotinia trifoliorum]
MAQLINNPGAHKPNLNMDEILTNLWIGDILSTYNISNLQSKNICTIISLIDQPLPQWLRTRYRELGISHKDFRVQDDALEDILCIMKDACDTIDKALDESRGVLVHCGLGISRSGTIVLGYVMRKKTLDRDQALLFVRQKRLRVQPNTGFWEQLNVWHDCQHDVFEYVNGENFLKELYREWKSKAGMEMSNRVLALN